MGQLLLLEFIQRDFGQYAMLKAIPNKNAGFIILLTSIFILFYLFYYYDQLLYELSVRFSLVDLELSLLLPYLHSTVGCGFTGSPSLIFISLEFIFIWKAIYEL